MGFLELLSASSMPVLKVLIVSGLGSFLALDRFTIFGEATRNQINTIVFYVFSPALVSSNLAAAITSENIVKLWFMPVNILITFILGSLLGWLLLLITRPPKHLNGLILGVCSAGNLGNLLLIIVPAVCKEKGSPFGDPDICHENGMAYATLSMAIGMIYIWTYIYNLVRIFSSHKQDSISNNINIKSIEEAGVSQEDLTQSLLPLKEGYSSSIDAKGKIKVVSDNIKHHLKNITRHINLKAVFAPSTIGAILGFVVGTIAPIQKLLIGATAPLRVIQDSASLIGEASIPTMTLIVGGNLLRGLKGSGISLSIITGIVTVRYILLPLFGILTIKGALYLGLVPHEPLYLFVLLLQFALPPAMNISVMTQLFGAGESECSVIMLWTYILASVSLTLWSTFFMWFVADA